MKSAVLATENTKASKVRLGDVCEIIGGGTPSKKISRYYEGDIPWASVRDMTEKLLVKTEFKITEEAVENSATNIIPKGEIIISTHVGLGKICILGQDTAINQDLKAIIPNESLSRDYLYQWFVAKGDYIKAHGHGVTVMGVNLDFIRNLSINLPSLTEQKRIAAELDLITKMIRNREAQLARLDTLVKAKFDEMFGRLNSEKRKLSCGVEEMFIGPFGSALKNECFVEENEAYCVVYEQKHAIHKNIKFPFRFVNRDKYEELKRFSIFPGDIIVSCRGTVGEVFVIPENAPLGIMHPSIMKIRLKESVFNKEYFLFMLSSYMQETQHKANGSSIKMAITATALGNELFPLPPLPLQKEFAAVVEEVDKSKAAIKKTIENLKTLYKARLQEYFA